MIARLSIVNLVDKVLDDKITTGSSPLIQSSNLISSVDLTTKASLLDLQIVGGFVARNTDKG